MLQLMDAREAIEKACYILDEEQTSPTIDYRYDSDEWPRELWYEAAVMQAARLSRSVGKRVTL